MIYFAIVETKSFSRTQETTVYKKTTVKFRTCGEKTPGMRKKVV